MGSTRPLPPLAIATALALGAAVSLGLARFSYALLLPPMRADLAWSYLTAGAMNTANAAGYLLGALLMPRALAHWGARPLLIAGSVSAAGLLAAHGLARADNTLYALRLLTGVASAATFVSGGLLAARLTGAPSGLVLGIYYGGTGAGIIASALLVPPLVALPDGHGWRWAWAALGAVALLATLVAARATRGVGSAAAAASAAHGPSGWTRLGFGLASYFLFGLGYIGYMTFVVTLLREQQMSHGFITVFYGALGAGVIASSFVWAGLLQRHRSGRPMAVLNGVLTVATVLPVLSTHPLAVLASGVLFGGVFLSVVASTTALVRHNLAAAAWPAGIAAFTIVFAAGQIVGPSLVGWLADGAGGLRAGLAVSAGVLALGALLASCQRALPMTEQTP
ncbi:YbfB/YjiJ family MFS transporter [Piscinibacter sp. HJYY11]|uniref:YbfB/YjiJ family MFS transporter n=1 Tax=Piscinibacter sp. HJYY11 TaxID=2801333 RepID=UPI00191D17A1|nr:YbfB/YjiJ family MFS transporter [Piscinibacter sp. HJYY11]MBL0729860.1 YbfB/YjiJ family MFS transporter [Piscinibacter sp. HJYY11]